MFNNWTYWDFFLNSWTRFSYAIRVLCEIICTSEQVLDFVSVVWQYISILKGKCNITVRSTISEDGIRYSKHKWDLSVDMFSKRQGRVDTRLLIDHTVVCWHVQVAERFKRLFAKLFVLTHKTYQIFCTSGRKPFLKNMRFMWIQITVVSELSQLFFLCRFTLCREWGSNMEITGTTGSVVSAAMWELEPYS